MRSRQPPAALGRVQHVDVGTVTAFEAFFRAEHPKLVALGWALTGDPHAAAELAQEALLRAYRDWAKVGEYDNPGGWIRRVLVNLIADRGRRRRSEEAALARVAPPGPVPELEPATDHWWRAVRALPEGQRAAVALHYLEDLSVADVAATLGISEGTVKTQLSRARETLSRTLPEEASS
jgi:RNA polymerase sigma-70 factor (sigma-E family)